MADFLFAVNLAEWDVPTEFEAGCELGEVEWPVQCGV